MVRAILEDPSFSGTVGPIEITEAQSGFDAMRLLPRARYDLIITDINMPDVNGLELIHFIRKSDQYRATPLVIISTQATERSPSSSRRGLSARRSSSSMSRRRQRSRFRHCCS